MPAVLDGLRHHRPREGRAHPQGRGQPDGPQLARQAVRAGPGGAQPPVPPRAPALPAQAGRPARRRQVAPHHLGGGLRRARDAAEEGPRVRQARGVRLPPGPQPQQGRDQPLPARVRHQHRAQPPRPVLGLTPRRGADVSVRVRLGPRRLRALEVHPELRLEHVRGAPGPRRRRPAHPARPLRQRRQAGDLRRADVEHGRQQRRVLHARARHRRRRRARHGAHHHQREALRRGVLPRLGQRAARRALGADPAVHPGVGRGDLDDPRRDHPAHRARVRRGRARRDHDVQPRLQRARQRLHQRPLHHPAQRAGRLGRQAGRALLDVDRRLRQEAVPRAEDAAVPEGEVAARGPAGVRSRTSGTR